LAVPVSCPGLAALLGMGLGGGGGGAGARDPVDLSSYEALSQLEDVKVTVPQGVVESLPESVFEAGCGEVRVSAAAATRCAASLFI
jgi:hypothetical protein